MTLTLAWLVNLSSLQSMFTQIVVVVVLEALSLLRLTEQRSCLFTVPLGPGLRLAPITGMVS